MAARPEATGRATLAEVAVPAAEEVPPALVTTQLRVTVPGAPGVKVTEVPVELPTMEPPLMLQR